MTPRRKKAARLVVVNGINYGPDDTRLEPGDEVDRDTFDDAEVKGLLAAGALEEVED